MLVTSLPQFHEYSIYVYLFCDVKNSAELRGKVAELPFALIDASAICSREQLFSAIYKTILENTYNRIRTKSLNSECILSLSPTSNIGEAFRRFGINEHSSNIVCLAIVPKSDAFDSNLALKVVDGEELDFSDENLATRFKIDVIKKVCY
ncbi:LAFE_0F13718g1_1 [Lachancea fermentati]|uniref:EKC/KEOPS complex subunit CGI121 n=1 Tax=Lachancea fermentati TaxID=4955 RepID=A0A1G4MFT5_LACFM|nr:LAFE_0F13718g1_1 [Lachancea fermentati]